MALVLLHRQLMTYSQASISVRG